MRRLRVDELDVEPLDDAAKLRLAVAALRVLGVDAENPVPVAVKRQRTAMGEHVPLQRQKIGAPRLRRRELQRDQAARRVIDEHDQRAARPAPLEPVVRRAVDLDEFAKPAPAITQLVDPLLLAPLRAPQLVRHLQPPDRLARHLDTLAPGQLFSRERRAKPLILVPQKPQNPRLNLRLDPQRRCPPALARDKAPVAIRPKRPHQPLHLPHANPQTFRALALKQLPRDYRTHDARPFALRRAHRQ